MIQGTPLKTMIDLYKQLVLDAKSCLYKRGLSLLCVNNAWPKTMYITNIDLSTINNFWFLISYWYWHGEVLQLPKKRNVCTSLDYSVAESSSSILNFWENFLLLGKWMLHKWKNERLLCYACVRILLCFNVTL